LIQSPSKRQSRRLKAWITKSLTMRCSEPLAGTMTLIEVRPHRWGWKVFEAPGVEPVFQAKQDAIS